MVGCMDAYNFGCMLAGTHLLMKARINPWMDVRMKAVIEVLYCGHLIVYLAFTQ